MPRNHIDVYLSRAGGWEYLVDGLAGPRFYNEPPREPKKRLRKALARAWHWAKARIEAHRASNLKVAGCG